MFTPRVRFERLLATATALSMGLAVLASAPASSAPLAAPVVAYSNFNEFDIQYYYDLDPTDPTYLSLNSRTVSGTSAGTTGDLVDVVCVGRSSTGTLAEDVAVEANGSWSTTFDLGQIYLNFGPCKLAAVWNGESAPAYGDIAAFPITFFEMGLYSRKGGVVTHASFQMNGEFVYIGSDSTYGGSDSSGLMTPEGSKQYSSQAFDRFSGRFASQPDSNYPTHDVIIDGKKGYTGATLAYKTPRTHVNTAPEQYKTEFSVLADPSTGNYYFTETGSIFFCQTETADGITDPGCIADSTTAMIDSGVDYKRTTLWTQNGYIYILDEFIVTDGKNHELDYSARENGANFFYVSYPQSGLTGAETGKQYQPYYNWPELFPASVTGFDGPAIVDLKEKPDLPLGLGSNGGGSLIAYPGPESIDITQPDTSRPYFEVKWMNRALTPDASAKFIRARLTAASNESLASMKATTLEQITEIDPEQTITWNAETEVTTATKKFSANAVSAQGGSITYSVVDAGTTGCTVHPTSGAVSFAAEGECEIEASGARMANVTPTGYGYKAASVSLVFEVGAAVQTCANTLFSKILFKGNATELERADKEQLLKALRKAKKAGCATLKFVGRTAKTSAKKGLEAKRADIAQERAAAVRKTANYYNERYEFGFKFAVAIVKRGDASPVDNTAAEIKAANRADVVGVK